MDEQLNVFGIDQHVSATGSCWAFPTIAAVEGINQIVTGELISLSEQELVDCDQSYDAGCNGGLMDYAFQFIIDNGGIDTKEDYPYVGVDGTCDASGVNPKVVSIDGYVDVPAYDERALKKAVAHHLVSVAIEAGGRAFQLYESGVFTGECGNALDHGVIAFTPLEAAHAVHPSSPEDTTELPRRDYGRIRIFKNSLK